MRTVKNFPKVEEINDPQRFKNKPRLAKSQQVSKSEEYTCANNMTLSVILRPNLDDNLMKMGQAREITNRIQKLRKPVGISIGDYI